MSKTVKVLIPLSGIYIRGSNDDIFPIKLRKGIKLVKIESPSKHGSFKVKKYRIKISGAEDLVLSQAEYNYPVFELSPISLLFEIQEKKEGHTSIAPHVYVNSAVIPITILRIFNDGEFITPKIVTELGIFNSEPYKEQDQLEPYYFNSDKVEQFIKFNNYFYPQFRKKRNGTNGYSKLGNRVNNAIQLFNKTYFSEFGFHHYDKYRLDNYLRLILCWLGIESLILSRDSNTEKALKNKLAHFFPNFTKENIEKFVTKYYGIRSNFIHADSSKIDRILNKEVNAVRNVLKVLIMLFIEILNDPKTIEAIDKSELQDPLKYLCKIRSISKFYNNFEENSGINLEQYNLFI